MTTVAGRSNGRGWRAIHKTGGIGLVVKDWQVVIEGEPKSIRLDRSLWSGIYRIWVDDRLTATFQGGQSGRLPCFEVGGHPCCIRPPEDDLRPDLFVDRFSVTTGEPLDEEAEERRLAAARGQGRAQLRVGLLAGLLLAGAILLIPAGSRAETAGLGLLALALTLALYLQSVRPVEPGWRGLLLSGSGAAVGALGALLVDLVYAQIRGAPLRSGFWLTAAAVVTAQAWLSLMLRRRRPKS